MKSFALVLASFLSVSAFAEPVSFKTYLHSDYVPGAGKISITTLDDGRLLVNHDRNSCTPDGRICTKAMYPSVTVEAKVIEDRRPVDGALILQLTDTIKLVVSSAFNATGKEQISALVTSGREADVEIRVEMKSETALFIGR